MRFGILVLAALAIAVAGAALFARRDRSPRSPEVAADDDDAIDRSALEQAEREVRDMEGDEKGKPTDDVVGDDWGPGAGRTPLG